MDTGTTVIYIQKTIYQNNKCVYNCITKYTLNEKTQVNHRTRSFTSNLKYIFLFYIYIAIGWVVDLNHSSYKNLIIITFFRIFFRSSSSSSSPLQLSLQPNLWKTKKNSELKQKFPKNL